MQNPWLKLPEMPDFVLEIDKPIITEFNKTAKPEHCIHIEAFPGPFMGQPNAPVVLLSLNPGFAESDVAGQTPETVETVAATEIPSQDDTPWKNLFHEPIKYPFYLLNPDLRHKAAGHKWWYRKLRWLIEQTNLETVANNLLCVEYFPYPSRKFGYCQYIPSQDYSLYLIREAIERKATIVCMRSWRLWENALPDLKTYPNYFRVKNPQNPAISPNNCPPRRFDEIVASLKQYSI